MSALCVSERVFPRTASKRSTAKRLAWLLAAVSYPISWFAGGWIGFYGGFFVAEKIERFADWPHEAVATIAIPVVQMILILIGCLGVPFLGLLIFTMSARMFTR